MKLIILITSDIESGLEVANRWQDAGAPGVTIVKSVGLHSLQQKTGTSTCATASKCLLHIASSMTSLMAFVLREMEHTNHVLLSVVPAAVLLVGTDPAGRSPRCHGRPAGTESRCRLCGAAGRGNRGAIARF